MVVKRKLQVFVSSTFTDLLEERQAAVAAILKAGHIPAGMELFTAGDQSQMKTIERWIDESDLYMLILGARYGSIEPNSSLSYTELEYDYAISQGKPTFAVVITEDAIESKAKSGGTAHIETTDPQGLKRFRKKVLSNISSFFADPKDVKLCVYESLSDYATNQDLRGWIAADDVEDTKTLNEEIRRLREENATLTERLQNIERAAESKQRIRDAESNELLQILESIEIEIPAEITKNKKLDTRTLFDIAYANRDTLINGVSNGIGMSELSRFHYFNVLPKLQAHGLAENERVTGTKYRRSFLNKAGQKFFADLEKKFLLAKNKESQASPSSEPKPNGEGDTICGDEETRVRAPKKPGTKKKSAAKRKSAAKKTVLRS
ncbi:DUF4062 domain-containing protein [Methyloceanibacter marginalis]|uniref:DUF4062 domain-containing protein n=1 Tax=Methyloceanibacter marginalis TaxID=1774971 RepID=UPI00084C4936|nr:DUF4062 domain-containing protein [Methyloceanibacter marginalis]